jgi:hypothetical protein
VILRDPVHGLVSFEGNAERVIETLLDTREVQRLRRVRQLGLTALVFPGAEHTRFSHALGAAHVMARLQDRIRARQQDLPPEHRMDDGAAQDALAAALLHDLGHGPFSHTFEEVLPEAGKHEQWTIEAIRNPETEVHRALESLSAGMAERVASLLSGEYPLGYLARAVSGTLDVDRSDYLLRDSHMTGARYGLYDLDWVLRSLTFARVPDADPNDAWVLAVEGRKGLPPIEGFFLGRHFMYQQVYHHKATRAAESVIRAIFVRVAELVRAGEPPRGVPSIFTSAARGEPVSLEQYFELDDAQLMSSFAEWEVCRDPELRQLARRIRHRSLPKTVPLPEDGRDLWDEARRRVTGIAERHGMRGDLSVWLDVPTDTPYAEPQGQSPEGLWVQIRHRPVHRLGDASFLLGELRNKRLERPRLIFPAEIRDEALSALEGVLG